MHIQDCEAPGYKVPAYNAGELRHDQIKKQLSGHIIFDKSTKRLWANTRCMWAGGTEFMIHNSRFTWIHDFKE